MNRLTRVLIVGVCCLFYMGSITLPSPNQPTKFDANRLKTGTFEYHDFAGNKDLGKSRITIEKVPGSDALNFSSVVTGNFSQRWLAVVRPTFEPISAMLNFGEDPGTPIFEITYSSSRVTGFVVERKGPNAGNKRIVDDAVGLSIVDQRVDWAAVSASDFGADPEFEFDVYDPGVGISHVLARRGSQQSLRVPAGEFQVYPITYEIKKRSGSEIYRVFVSKDQPRILVREDFPQGAESDLVAVNPKR